MTDQTAGIGHNKPPTDMEIFREWLTEQVKPIRDRIAELTVAFTRAPTDFSNPTNVQRCTDFVAQCKATLKAAEERRVELKRPLDQQAKLIQDTFKTMAEQLERPMRELEGRLGEYAAQQRRAAEEKARLERQAAEAEANRLREEAERQAREAALAAARATTEQEAQRAADQMARAMETQGTAQAAQQVAEQAGEVQKTKLEGEYGSTGYASRRWVFDITDLAVVPRQYLKLDDTAIREAIRSGVREIPGLHIYQEEKFTVKGVA